MDISQEADILLNHIISKLPPEKPSRWLNSKYKNTFKLKTKKLGEQFSEKLVGKILKNKGYEITYLPKQLNVNLTDKHGDIKAINNKRSFTTEVKTAKQKELPDNRFTFNHIIWKGSWQYLTLVFIFPNTIKFALIPKRKAEKLKIKANPTNIQGTWNKFKRWELK